MSLTLSSAVHHPPARGEHIHEGLACSADPVVLSAARRIRLTAAGAGPSLWRITDRAGVVVGHVRALGSGADLRFRALRYRAATQAFLTLGDFWSCDQALECLRLSR